MGCVKRRTERHDKRLTGRLIECMRETHGERMRERMRETYRERMRETYRQTPSLLFIKTDLISIL
jgi:hypothetical protein